MWYITECAYIWERMQNVMFFNLGNFKILLIHAPIVFIQISEFNLEGFIVGYPFNRQQNAADVSFFYLSICQCHILCDHFWL